ncbi:MAG TPA: hypothetical protein ENK06_05785 [Gammaproteobacteria bacterium]|nr:hypothetical protein [Gammaproteobacteria bacterium]
MYIKWMPNMFLGGILSIFFLTCAHAADVNQSYAIKGAGSVACDRYVNSLNEKPKEYLVFSGWIDGYITAFNQFQEETFDVTPWQSTFLLTKALEKYCKKNPKAPFFNALTRMLQALQRERLKKRSELIKINTGKSALLIYKDIVKRIQTKLNLRHKHAVKVDGLYGESTEAALRKFQQENKIPVSGIPDQVTLQLLFRK